jgi:hypothetical protein
MVAPMQKTIRDQIKRRARWMVVVSFGGFLIIGSTALFGVDRPQRVIVALGWLIFLGGLVAMRWIKCPKCSARIGQTIAMPLAFPRFLVQRPNHCLYCGVSLDDPMPHAAQVAVESQNPIK